MFLKRLPCGDLQERSAQCVGAGARLRLQRKVGTGMPDHPRIVTDRLELAPGPWPDHEVAVELQEDYRNAQSAQVLAHIFRRNEAEPLGDDLGLERLQRAAQVPRPLPA